MTRALLAALLCAFGCTPEDATGVVGALCDCGPADAARTIFDGDPRDALGADLPDRDTPADAARRPADAWPDLSLDATPDAALNSVDATVDAAPDLVDAAPDMAPDAAPDAAPGGCRPGERRACGATGDRCLPGAQLCGEDGAFGECLGGLLPEPVERCDGVDQDCDGRIDEGLSRPCGAAPGCRPGRAICRDGIWGPCDGAGAPRDELCDGVDDDCDGRVDEDLLRPCGHDQGQCRAGIERCVDGRYTDCRGAVLPAPETCDGRDEDCDGRVDEGLFRPCGPDACGPEGISLCTDGAFGPCQPRRPPVVETCDGVDEDCDGDIDENLIVPCGPEAGLCRAGAARCVDGQFGACEGGVPPADEQCNGFDDDCDGDTDEAVPPAPCGSDVGECRQGQRRCRDGFYGPCEGEVRPTAERCNDRDDDCDGTVDEDACADGDDPD